MEWQMRTVVGGTVSAVLTVVLVWPTLLFASSEAQGGGRRVSRTGMYAASFGPRETRTLRSPAMSLSVSLEETADGVRFVLDSITDPMTGIVLDTSASPIWQVMVAGTGTPPPGTSFPPDSQLVDGSVMVPEGHAAWGPSEPGILELRWTGLIIPGGQTLDVTVSIRLRDSDGFAEWSMNAQLSDGPSMLVSTAFPLLDLPGIGEDASDDVLFHPTEGGSVVRNPVGCGRFMEEFSPITEDPSIGLIYPGAVDSQFMSLYDGDLGLYLAAEDRAGAVKGLVYAGEGRHLRLWIRNYNTTPYDESRTVMASALRAFDLAALGYPIVVGFHHGDWMDAADLYRRWAVEAGVPFLANGPLMSRTDIGERVKDAVMNIRYSFGFSDADAVELEEDEERLGAALDFFRANEPDLNISVSLVGVISGREDADIPRESWYGSIGRPELDGDLKPGVAEFIDWLANTYGIPAGHNRDTGHWRTIEGTTELALYESEDALHRAIARRWDGTPHVLPWSEIQKSICGGSQWQLARRKAIRTATVFDSRGTDHTKAGFRFLIISGMGEVAKLCYAPLLADNPAKDHRHPVGGGSWWMDSFSAYAASLRSLYGQQAPFYTLIPEPEHERLIGVPGFGILGGKSRWYPFSDDAVTQAGGPFLPCSQPVPMSMYLYHEWVLQGTQGVYLSDFVDEFGAAYGEDGLLVPHPNFQVAVAALTGRLLPLKLRGYHLAANEDPAVDGPFFDQLDPAVQQDWNFLRLLAETRYHNLPYLAWGRMLRFPTVTTDIIQLEAHRDGTIRTYPVRAVLASAFRAADGTIELFAVNPTRTRRTFTVSFDPADYGITGGAHWRLVQMDAAGHGSFVGWVRPEAVYASPEISIDPLSILVFALEPPAPAPRHPSGRVPR